MPGCLSAVALDNRPFHLATRDTHSANATELYYSSRDSAGLVRIEQKYLQSNQLTHLPLLNSRDTASESRSIHDPQSTSPAMDPSYPQHHHPQNMQHLNQHHPHQQQQQQQAAQPPQQPQQPYDLNNGGHYGASAAIVAAGVQPQVGIYTGPFTNVSQGLQGNYKDILSTYWEHSIMSLESEEHDYKSHQLPLARIKKVMKADPEVKMISAEAPILFAKGCDMFITEVTMRAWIHAEENKRRTLQRSDIANALAKSDMYDFLIDIVPREEATSHTKRSTAGGTGAASSAASASSHHPAPQQQVPTAPVPPNHQGMMPPQGGSQAPHPPGHPPGMPPQQYGMAPLDTQDPNYAHYQQNPQGNTYTQDGPIQYDMNQMYGYSTMPPPMQQQHM
ncbi:hypothetical protein TWF730_005753 [Orbilia blumenaviensis]|uniref:Core Histone H2A/H2B/H3 domain-containing protein n=1 Tax=Orbilia blumenaviensis TaxID=1796055 RepID=A0AAV9VLF8_9PEZI